jgi:NAD(P) transhydrogenase subunit beta
MSGNVTTNLVQAAYIVAAVLFVLSLAGLSKHEKAKEGNAFGVAGMVLALGATIWLSVDRAGHPVVTIALIAVAMAVGAAIGLWRARIVEMTGMPELIALLHSFVGLAAVLVGWNGALYDTGLTGALADIHHAEVFIAVAAVLEPSALLQNLPHGEPIPTGNRLELFLGAAIGAITFSGSVIAFGKLSGTYKFRLFKGAPVVFPGQHKLNLVLGLVTIALGLVFMATESWTAFFAMLALAFVMGVLIIIPIGGADMPVVVSMLNSYSGWAAAGIGFSLNNQMLIIAGSLVGSSGAILSYIMCKAMNRSFFNVILGGFGGEGATAAAGEAVQRSVKSGSADDAAFILGNAETVVIVPGYGLAVARAQHAVKELAGKLTDKGITVKYAIHPVAGRMPGHMNVLLAEAEVPYDQVFEMEDINGEFGQADVAIVLGANDVVNPAALQKGTPIYGMPILEAYKAKTVIVIKRSMAAGYAGLDNELFYMDKTMMVFGDAKKVVEDMVKAVE